MRFESELVEVLFNHFQSSGFKVLKSVRIPPREIDLVMLHPVSLMLVSVEVKLKSISNVVGQALDNQNYSHYSMIALPHSVAVKIPVGLLEQHGLGLIVLDEVDSEIVIQVKPKKNSASVNTYFKKRLYREFTSFLEEII